MPFNRETKLLIITVWNENNNCVHCFIHVRGILSVYLFIPMLLLGTCALDTVDYVVRLNLFII